MDSVLLFAYCLELGLVAVVNGNDAMNFVSVDHGPAAPFGCIHLVVSSPGPLDAGLSVLGAVPLVDVAANISELEAALAVRLEFNEAFDLGVHNILGPHLHRRDARAPFKWGWRFRFLCHCLVSLLPLLRRSRCNLDAVVIPDHDDPGTDDLPFVVREHLQASAR
jgi:hypothetical protein